jgi:hypothetical protein
MFLLHQRGSRKLTRMLTRKKFPNTKRAAQAHRLEPRAAVTKASTKPTVQIAAQQLNERSILGEPGMATNIQNDKV